MQNYGTNKIMQAVGVSSDKLQEVYHDARRKDAGKKDVTFKIVKSDGSGSGTTSGTATQTDRPADAVTPKNPAQADTVEKAILTANNDNDQKGSTFSLLQAKGTAKSNTSVKLTAYYTRSFGYQTVCPPFSKILDAPDVR